MADKKNRIEKDSMGEMEIPIDMLYGATTQRAIQNFPISFNPMPIPFIKALILIKKVAAQVNCSLELLPKTKSDSIVWACNELEKGGYEHHFPVDIFQTGSGTSSNMNVNEVIANLCKQHSKGSVHPNDHVNMSQSSNDCIPTALAISSATEISHTLIPNLKQLSKIIIKKAHSLRDTVTTGRTHLMDAMPVTLEQVAMSWAKQIDMSIARLEDSLERLFALPQGGTAVGTGINAHVDFAHQFCILLSKDTGLRFTSLDNKFYAMSSIDNAVEVSGQLNTLATALMKIANDLRWMNSGPLAGIGEISLPSLQPGSSIMPGKVNPVIPEATAMVCAQVMGNHQAITIAGQSGNFQLNVMLPVAAYNLLFSIQILSSTSLLLGTSAIAGFTVNQDKINISLESNPILVTALNSVVGYELGAKIAKTSYSQKRSVLEVATELTNLSEEELKKLLNPKKLTAGGIP